MPAPRTLQRLVGIGLFLIAVHLPSAVFALNENGRDAVDQPVSAAEEEEAIRWVMKEGAQSMIDRLGRENGFYNDPNYRIPMPEQFRKLEKVVRRLGGAKYADAFLLSLNRTAENALAEGGPLIISVIDEVPIDNRENLINGSGAPIGNHFHSRVAKVILSRFSPIVAEHADKAGLISSMNMMLEKARFVKTIHEQKAKLDRMIMEHVIALLVIAIRAEEARIKNSPLKSVNPLIQKVFSG